MRFAKRGRSARSKITFHASQVVPLARVIHMVIPCRTRYCQAFWLSPRCEARDADTATEAGRRAFLGEVSDATSLREGRLLGCEVSDATSPAESVAQLGSSELPNFSPPHRGGSPKGSGFHSGPQA